jgi:hypothetical protein
VGPNRARLHPAPGGVNPYLHASNRAVLDRATARFILRTRSADSKGWRYNAIHPEVPRRTGCSATRRPNAVNAGAAALIDYRDGHFASRVVHRDRATLGRIAVRVELATVGARLLRGALSRVQAHDVVSRAHRVTARVARGVNRLQDTGLLRVAIRTREIILAVSVEDSLFRVVQKFRSLHAAVIVHVNFFRPV